MPMGWGFYSNIKFRNFTIMQNVLLLILGGAVGTLLRYGMVEFIKGLHNHPIPFGTLTVNLIGSLVIGLLWGVMGGAPSPSAKHLLFIGLLGGYTTFSSYALETLVLARNGQMGMAITYVLLSNVLGLLLVAIGFFAGNAIKG